MKLTSTFLYYCYICFNLIYKKKPALIVKKFNILTNATSFKYHNLFKMYAVLDSAYQINSMKYHSLLFFKEKFVIYFLLQ